MPICPPPINPPENEGRKQYQDTVDGSSLEAMSSVVLVCTDTSHNHIYESTHVTGGHLALSGSCRRLHNDSTAFLDY